MEMAALRSLWIALTTGETLGAGTDANFFLEFGLTGKSVALPDQPGNDTEMPLPVPLSAAPATSGNGTTYLFDVNLDTTDFVPGTVSLRHDNKGLPLLPVDPLSAWQCRSILITGLGEDGKVYPIAAMPEVNRWLGAETPGGSSIVIDVLKRSEVGLPAAS
jgi:hypothetical protein